MRLPCFHLVCGCCCCTSKLSHDNCIQWWCDPFLQYFSRLFCCCCCFFPIFSFVLVRFWCLCVFLHAIFSFNSYCLLHGIIQMQCFLVLLLLSLHVFILISFCLFFLPFLSMIQDLRKMRACYYIIFFSPFLFSSILVGSVCLADSSLYSV